MKRLYNLGIYPEWWKLAPMPASQWKAIDALIAERDPHCRGVLVLGLNAGVDALADGFRDAAASARARASRWAGRFSMRRRARGSPARSTTRA